MGHAGRSGSESTDDRRPVALAKVRVPEIRALRLVRLEGRLASVWERRLGVVVAPAGSGKTTLLAGFAASADAAVAWYRAETWDSRPQVMLRHLHSAFAAALRGATADSWDERPWTSVEAAAAAIDAIPRTRFLLVVDDLHALEGTAAESELERLVAYAPRHLAVIVASRAQPSFNLSRRRVEGALLEIGSDDLRFRSWEVERLFREVYGLAIPPQELATLARRTEGWAAGLQLFRLAIDGKSPDERRRLLSEGGSSGRFMREYLARNVLTDLPTGMRDFLVETSVLGRLSPTLCDGLLERTGTGALLEELERRQVFTTQHEDGSYRYHEVLRTHLEAILVETHGEAATRERFERAGRLLMAQEEISDALVAFARAANWEVVERLVRSRGERLVAERVPGTWFDALPAALVRNDPWLILASARRSRDEGRWAQAASAFQSAEAAFGSSEGAAIARRERAAVMPWLDDRPRPPITADGPALLRSLLARDPAAVRAAAAGLDGPWRSLVTGVAAILVGRPSDASAQLASIRDQPGASPAVAHGAALAEAVASVLAGETRVVEPRVERPPTEGSTPWLDRVARAVAVLGPEAGRPSLAELDSLIEACADASDAWGELLIGLLAGWAMLEDGRDLPATSRRFERSAEQARRAGAGVIAAWALALAAIAAERAGDRRAIDLKNAAEQASRAAMVRAPASLGEVMLATHSRVPFGSVATRRDKAGVRLPDERVLPQAALTVGEVRDIRREARRSEVRVRSFGEFELEVDGQPLAHTSIRPRARSVLHLLAVHAGEPLHREMIEAAIWPTDTTGASASRLHVAISSIRHLLQADRAAGAGLRIDRDRETYRLVLPPEAELDTRAFEEAVAASRAYTDRDDLNGAGAESDRAVALYAGPLLIEEGPAEWVLEPRERYRTMVIEMIQLQATVALRQRDPTGAAAACTAGLAVERYHDPFWRLLIEAREMAGDRGAAVRAEGEYHAMLAQLGVEPALAGGR